MDKSTNPSVDRQPNDALEGRLYALEILCMYMMKELDMEAKRGLLEALHFVEVAPTSGTGSPFAPPPKTTRAFVDAFQEQIKKILIVLQ